VLRRQRHGKDPFAYLKDVLTRLPAMTNQDDLTALTPTRWSPS
jgi:transposase